jgi:hypothetical protein
MTVKIKTKVKSRKIDLKDNIDKLLGKDVEITIKTLNDKTNKRTWKSLGIVGLGKKLDNKNIRSLAYE